MKRMGWLLLGVIVVTTAAPDVASAGIFCWRCRPHCRHAVVRSGGGGSQGDPAPLDPPKKIEGAAADDLSGYMLLRLMIHPDDLRALLNKVNALPAADGNGPAPLAAPAAAPAPAPAPAAPPNQLPVPAPGHVPGHASAAIDSNDPLPPDDPVHTLDARFVSIQNRILEVQKDLAVQARLVEDESVIAQQRLERLELMRKQIRELQSERPLRRPVVEAAPPASLSTPAEQPRPEAETIEPST